MLEHNCLIFGEDQETKRATKNVVRLIGVASDIVCLKILFYLFAS